MSSLDHYAVDGRLNSLGYSVITASKVNGPFILRCELGSVHHFAALSLIVNFIHRHELGHTLIPAGEEYDGGKIS